MNNIKVLRMHSFQASIGSVMDSTLTYHPAGPDSIPGWGGNYLQKMGTSRINTQLKTRKGTTITFAVYN